MSKHGISHSRLDIAAFKTLFERYYTGLVMYAAEFGIRVEDAEDIVHDIFVSIWVRRERLDADGIKSYLFRAVQNNSIRFISHLKVRTNYHIKVLNEQKPAEALGIEYYVESELEQIFKKAIDRLPHQRRKVFILNRFEGKSLTEIGEELCISPRTAEKHLELALNTLRIYLGRYAPLFFGTLFLLSD